MRLYDEHSLIQKLTLAYLTLLVFKFFEHCYNLNKDSSIHYVKSEKSTL